jgi:hypothetical protein
MCITDLEMAGHDIEEAEESQKVAEDRDDN